MHEHHLRKISWNPSARVPTQKLALMGIVPLVLNVGQDPPSIEPGGQHCDGKSRGKILKTPVFPRILGTFEPDRTSRWPTFKCWNGAWNNACGIQRTSFTSLLRWGFALLFNVAHVAKFSQHLAGFKLALVWAENMSNDCEFLLSSQQGFSGFDLLQLFLENRNRPILLMCVLWIWLTFRLSFTWLVLQILSRLHSSLETNVNSSSSVVLVSVW